MRVMKNRTLFESFQENLKEIDSNVKKLNEDTILWSSDLDDDYADWSDEDFVNEYRNYTGEEPESAEQARDFFINDDDDAVYDAKREDLQSWVDEFQKQTTDNIIIMSGNVGVWTGNHSGGKVIDLESADDLLTDYDSTIRLKDEGGNVIWDCAHHDGEHYMGLYALPKDEDARIKLVTELGIVDWYKDMYDYESDEDALQDALSCLTNVEDLKNALSVEDYGKLPQYCPPIKSNITVKESSLKESALEPQYAARKSFYGKADVRTDDDGWKILKSYKTDVAKAKDGKFEIITNDVDDLTQTTLRHIREFLQQEGITPPTKSELVKMITDKDLTESDEEDEFEDYTDFTDGDIVLDIINNFKSITGRDIKEIFNYEDTGNEDEAIFKQKEIDATAPAIDKYLQDKGVDRQRRDELMYKLDDELTRVWYQGLHESFLGEEFDLDSAVGDVSEVAESIYKGSEINSSTIESLLNSDERLKDKYSDNQKEKIVKWFEDEEKKFMPMQEQDQTVRVVTNVQEDRDYTITDITELNQVADGDVQPPIDITGLLNEVDARLNESVGTDWGVINYQSTRFNVDTKDSNALFELCVGDKTYLMSMLLEENGSLLKVNNTKGQTIFKRKSNDMVGLAESYIKQFIPKKEKENSYIIKHMNNDLHSRLEFIKSHIKELKSAKAEDKEAFRSFIQDEIYSFAAELSGSIDKEEPNDDDTSKLPTFDDMVQEVFGKEWVKKADKENKLELDGVEELKEEFIPNHEGLHCPKCGSNEYYDVDDEEYPDGTQKCHYECKKCGYKSEKDEFNHEDLNEENYLKKYYNKLDKMSDKELYRAWLEVKDAPDEVGGPEEVEYTLASDALWEIEGELARRGFMDEDSNKTEKWKELEESSLNESYCIVSYYKGFNEAGDKVINGSSPKDVENKVRRFAEKDGIEIESITQASADVCDSEYLNSLGRGVLRKDAFSSKFESINEDIEDPIKDDVKNDLAIEPGSDEEAALDALYEPTDDDDELNEPATGLGTGYAKFARKASDVSDAETKADSFTAGESSYVIVSKEVLDADEFDRLSSDLLKDNEYCKRWEPLDTENYSFNVIEFSCPDYDYKLLVDPSGFNYCRYVAVVPERGKGNENR